MQIHEITQIQEGVLGTIGKDIAGAVTAPFKKLGAILDQPDGLTSPTATGAGLDQYYRGQSAKNQTIANKVTQQATQQWAQRLAAEWNHAAQSLPKAPGPAAPGQMSAGMASSKTGQNMQQMFGAPRGGIQGMQSDLEEAAPAEESAQYKKSFLEWVNKKTATRVPGTTVTLTADEAHQEAGASLNPALDNVLATQNDPEANQQAVQTYLLQLARVMQQMSANIKTQYKQRETSASTVSPLSDLISDSTIEQIKARAQDPVKAIAIKQLFGLR